MIAMFVTNEQISTAIQQTPNVVRASLKDFEIFLKVTHKQITFVLFEGMNKAVGKISADLEGKSDMLSHSEVYLTAMNKFWPLYRHRLAAG